MEDLIRTIVVDDEPVARQGVRRLLEGDRDIEVVAEAGDGPEAVRLIEELRPDLVLLDVQMPGMDGFDVIAEVGIDAMPTLVFVTAHDAFALRAFEVRALDYLLKPFDDERFRFVLERAKQHARAGPGGPLDRRIESLLKQHTTRPAHAVSRIRVKDAGTVFFQPVDEIDWIEAYDYFAKLHTRGKTHLVSETLASLERRLDPAVFMRVHRSAIVNLTRVRELRPDYRNRHVIVLTTGEHVPVSRSRRELLEVTLAGRPD